MAAVAVDTYAIVWYLTSDPRLSAKAAAALDRATAEGDIIHDPSHARSKRRGAPARVRLQHFTSAPAMASPLGSAPSRQWSR
jgi:hypothetical protein